tara:strand:+ start:664 stop:1128 length:465 start_codon:yes stop_codon:yes gene_type:complete
MSKPKPKSILSFDLGHKRIGLAGCDALGLTITRLPAIHRKTFQEDLMKIKFLCQQRKVEGLIFGIPLDQKGHLTKQAQYCTRYGKNLAKSLDLPMAWVNEHSTSWEAQELYKLPKDRSGKLDSAAAGLLLEQWLREGPELKPVHMPAYPIRHVH